jgi:hypothetical protein
LPAWTRPACRLRRPFHATTAANIYMAGLCHHLSHDILVGTSVQPDYTDLASLHCVRISSRLARED